uniref:Uncharacterized protein n=1 Tax=Romanomermis culicivorax TaxID=13658 RepID=A0A915IA92_ROMCU
MDSWSSEPVELAPCVLNPAPLLLGAAGACVSAPSPIVSCSYDASTFKLLIFTHIVYNRCDMTFAFNYFSEQNLLCQLAQMSVHKKTLHRNTNKG